MHHRCLNYLVTKNTFNVFHPYLLASLIPHLPKIIICTKPTLEWPSIAIKLSFFPKKLRCCCEKLGSLNIGVGFGGGVRGVWGLRLGTGHVLDLVCKQYLDELLEFYIGLVWGGGGSSFHFLFDKR